MQFIIRLLTNNIVLLLFVFLQSIAVFLTISNRELHGNYFYKLTGGITGFFYTRTHAISSYFDLKSKNNDLSDENTLLKNKILALSTASDKDRVIENKFIKFIYNSANIISYTHSKKNNYAIINKGENDGVTKDMGIISNKGIIGIVKNTSSYYSIVMLIINEESTINVKFKKNRFLGFISWKNKKIIMSDVLKHSNISVGDTIVSYMNSDIFPRGIEIGTIKSFEASQDATSYNAEIDVFEDFNNLDRVYIVKNIFKKDLDTLKTMTNE